MQLEYQLTPQEYKDFNYYTSWSAPEKRNARLKYYLGSLGFYFLFFVVISLISKKNPTIIGLVVFSVFAILFMFYLKWRVRRQIERYVDKLVKESGESRIFARSELSITERGIHEKSIDAETSYQWSAVLKRAEAYNCYYLYINSRLALVIPKRVFGSTQEKQEFEKLLLRHLSLSADLPTVNTK